MGVTRLIRKTRKNRARANNKVQRVKQLTNKPVITQVDVEAIKAEFEKNKAAAPAPVEAEQPLAQNEAAPTAEVEVKEEVAAEAKDVVENAADEEKPEETKED